MAIKQKKDSKIPRPVSLTVDKTIVDGSLKKTLALWKEDKTISTELTKALQYFIKHATLAEKALFLYGDKKILIPEWMQKLSPTVKTIDIYRRCCVSFVAIAVGRGKYVLEKRTVCTIHRPGDLPPFNPGCTVSKII